MYLYIKVSKRKVKNHLKSYGGMPGEADHLVYIEAGTPYLHISNGTIGAGCRGYNLDLRDIPSLLERSIEYRSHGFSDQTLGKINDLISLFQKVDFKDKNHA